MKTKQKKTTPEFTSFTYLTKQIPASWEAENLPAIQKALHILQSLNFK
jgi:hypothetical protein